MSLFETTTDISSSVEVSITTAKLAWWNNCAACGLSIFLLVITTWVLILSKNISTLQKVVIVILNMSQVTFSILFIVACPMFGAIDLGDDFVGLMMVNAGIHVAPRMGDVFLMSSVVFLTQQIFNSPIFSFFRYLQVCRKGVHYQHVLIVVLSNGICLLLSSGALCFASAPTIEDIIHLSGMAVSYVGHETAFLVLSYDKSGSPVIALISGVTYVAMLIFSMILMSFFHHQINAKINSSTNMSDNLKKLQTTANQILTTQFVITILFIQIPFFYSVLGPLVGLSQRLATYVLSFLFVWGPVANTAGLFVFKTEVRRIVFHCAKDRDINIVNVVTENKSVVSKM